METIRAFIAVDMGDEIRAKLDEVQRRLKKVHTNVRWVKPQNMHLTLVFLGDISTDKLPQIKSALQQASENMKPFELIVSGIGFFGRPRHPRVIWAGVEECIPLMTLQKQIAEALQAADIEFDIKPFSPHLTLGRVKAPNHTELLLSNLEQYKETSFGNVCIDTVKLIQSELKPAGAEYSLLQRFKLG